MPDGDQASAALFVSYKALKRGLCFLRLQRDVMQRCVYRVFEGKPARTNDFL